jgi:prolyl oligopeptidase
VFYINDSKEWELQCRKMAKAGFVKVDSFNPYWDKRGKTFEDADGCRVVLQNSDWDG